MAKRSTIGENPLDNAVLGNPLDVVVPEPGLPGRGGPASLSEVKERLDDLEAGLQLARRELGQWRAETAALKTELTQVKSQGVKDGQQLGPELNRLKAEISRLGEEIAALQAEMSRIRTAAAGPGDLPWWMGGRKK